MTDIERNSAARRWIERIELASAKEVKRHLAPASARFAQPVAIVRWTSEPVSTAGIAGGRSGGRLLDGALEFVGGVRLDEAHFGRERHLMPIVEEQRLLRYGALVFHLFEFGRDLVRVLDRAGSLHRFYEHADIVVVEQRDRRLHPLRRAQCEILVKIVLCPLERRGAPAYRNAAQRDRDRGLQSPILPYARIDAKQEVGRRDVELDRLRVGDHHDVAVVPDVHDVGLIRLGAREQRREVLGLWRELDEIGLVAVGLERELVVRRQILPTGIVLDENDRCLRLAPESLLEQRQNALRGAAAALELLRLGLEGVMQRADGLGRVLGQTTAERAVAGELKHLGGVGDLCHGDREVVALGAPDRLDANIV